VGAVCIGAFMGQLDASVVTLTYPRLQSEFHAGFGSVAWVSLVYLLVLVVLLVPVGRWADSRGHKLLYLYGFVLFTFASAACALAPSLGWLVADRGVQAIGAAFLQANSVALVVLSVPAARIRTALGLQGAAQALGLALGPTLGGILVDAHGWRSVFWVNVLVGVVAIVAGQVLLPRSRDLNPPRRGDLRGFALLAAAVAAALLTLSGPSGMPVPQAALVGLALFAIVTALFFWHVDPVRPTHWSTSGFAAGEPIFPLGSNLRWDWVVQAWVQPPGRSPPRASLSNRGYPDLRWLNRDLSSADRRMDT
jgi:MFS family permease